MQLLKKRMVKPPNLHNSLKGLSSYLLLFFSIVLQLCSDYLDLPHLVNAVILGKLVALSRATDYNKQFICFRSLSSILCHE